MDKNFTDLKNKWPSTIVSRGEVGRFSGGLISPRYIANLDCQKLGPSERMRIGRKVAYPIDALCDWLAGRIRPVD